MPLDIIDKIKKLKIRLFPVPLRDLARRAAVQVSLGCHVVGNALPHPDPYDRDSVLAGILKRFACAPPQANPKRLQRLRRHVRQWLKDNLKPLDSTTDVTLEGWLAMTDYPEWRKEEIRLEFEKWGPYGLRSRKKNTQCSSFTKMETYPKFKHNRLINARSDVAKARFGPWFKAIEKEVFKLPWFIKKVSVKDRPTYIVERLYRYGAKYLATDYTSFEALFTRQIMETVEFQLYEYMTQALPGGLEFMDDVRVVLGGENECRFRCMSAKLKATRMSGEMCTSLGNGFSNLMFMDFMAKECGCYGLTGVVEGDDGLFSMTVGPGGHLPTKEDFASIGLIIKPEWHDELRTASFCGIVFDEDNRRNLRDPIPTLVGFGWSGSTYAKSGDAVLRELLRSKALSLAYESGGCPILRSLAMYGLRVTAGVRVRQSIIDKMGYWRRLRFMEAVKEGPDLRPIGIESRLLVETLYGVSVEAQLKAEAYLDSLDELQPLSFPMLDHLFNPQWNQYFSQYGFTGDRLDKDLDFPSSYWNQLQGFSLEELAPHFSNRLTTLRRTAEAGM